MQNTILEAVRAAADELRLATFRLWLRADKKECATGFFFTEELALTAYHCVGDAGQRRTFNAEYQDQSIRLFWERDLSWQAADIAVLRLREGGGSIHPVALGHLDLTEFERQRLWAGRNIVVLGYPMYIDHSRGSPSAKAPRRQFQVEWVIPGVIALDAAIVGSFELGQRYERLRIVGSGIPNAARLGGISGAPILDRDSGFVIGVQGSHDPELVDVRGSEIGLLLQARPQLRQWATDLGPILQPRIRPPHNLPTAVDTFVGREADCDYVAQLLQMDRLVTLTGPGGMGKTRLAIEVARELADGFPDGAWLVRLEHLTEPALLPDQAARDLGIRLDPAIDPTAALVEHLRPQRLLLVLDNCEHLVDASAILAERLLAGCPELRILATSREALRAPGEYIWPVPSLAVARPDETGAMESLLPTESVRLFVDRAQRRQGTFALDGRTGPAVATICRQLEGIPLAIELAAAWVGARSVEEIAAQVHDRFGLLTRGSRSAPTRHQTLRAAVDWSYDRLTPPERSLFDQLAVFNGTWTLDATQEVCGGSKLTDVETLDLLTSLVDKSLVIAQQRDGVTRYCLLETLRQYGWQHLAELPAAPNASSRAELAERQRLHAAHYLTFVERAAPHLWGAAQEHWLPQLDAEHDNVRAALAWCLDNDPPMALRFAAATWRFWQLLGYLTEGRRWLERALEQTPESNGFRARALLGAAYLARNQWDIDVAARRSEESLALCDAIGDIWGASMALVNLGVLARTQGDYPWAEELFTRALERARAGGHQLAIGSALWGLGAVARSQGAPARARLRLEEAATVLRTAGDRHNLSLACRFLGLTAVDDGRNQDAQRHLHESLALARAIDDPVEIGGSLHGLGLVALQCGEWQRAAALLHASRTHLEQCGDQIELAWTLDALGALALLRHEVAPARDLLSQSLTIFAATTGRQGIAHNLYLVGLLALQQQALADGVTLLAAVEQVHVLQGALTASRDRQSYESALAEARDRLGPEAYTLAWQRAAGVDLGTTVEFAQEVLTRPLVNAAPGNRGSPFDELIR